MGLPEVGRAVPSLLSVSRGLRRARDTLESAPGFPYSRLVRCLPAEQQMVAAPELADFEVPRHSRGLASIKLLGGGADGAHRSLPRG
jgi:hypothetical protein